MLEGGWNIKYPYVVGTYSSSMATYMQTPTFDLEKLKEEVASFVGLQNLVFTYETPQSALDHMQALSDTFGVPVNLQIIAYPEDPLICRIYVRLSHK